jgi:hypothetical protein
MTGLLDYPELAGLLPMPRWDDLAQRVSAGLGKAPFWHLPVAPLAAGATGSGDGPVCSEPPTIRAAAATFAARR